MAVREVNPYIPLILERLREINPAKVILFGSHAYGTASDTSDLDLLIVTNDEYLPQSHHEKEQVYLEVARLLRDIRSETAVDLIVHTRPMYDRFLKMNSLFAKEVQQNGVLLYESDHS